MVRRRSVKPNEAGSIPAAGAAKGEKAEVRRQKEDVGHHAFFLLRLLTSAFVLGDRLTAGRLSLKQVVKVQILLPELLEFRLSLRFEDTLKRELQQRARTSSEVARHLVWMKYSGVVAAGSDAWL
jgi:hypothetical protein